MLFVIGMAIGLIVFMLAELMVSAGRISRGVEYLLFSSLTFVVIWLLYLCAVEYSNRPLTPEIQRYSPDHIHVEYR